jgi:hypothetical protein
MTEQHYSICSHFILSHAIHDACNVSECIMVALVVIPLFLFCRRHNDSFDSTIKNVSEPQQQHPFFLAPLKTLARWLIVDALY